MNELGQTIIENYNTFAPKNMFSEWLKNLLQPLATLSLGFFVYKYTDNRHKKKKKKIIKRVRFEVRMEKNVIYNRWELYRHIR